MREVKVATSEHNLKPRSANRFFGAVLCDECHKLSDSQKLCAHCGSFAVTPIAVVWRVTGWSAILREPQYELYQRVEDEEQTGKGPWKASIESPDTLDDRSIVFKNEATGDQFYADGRPQPNDEYGKFVFSKGAVRRLIDRLNQK